MATQGGDYNNLGVTQLDREHYYRVIYIPYNEQNGVEKQPGCKTNMMIYTP